MIVALKLANAKTGCKVYLLISEFLGRDYLQRVHLS